jgi:ribosomal protein S27AE
VPKCPYCNKAVLVTPIKGRDANLPEPKGIWQRWFGETISKFKSKKIPCPRCGEISSI